MQQTLPDAGSIAESATSRATPENLATALHAFVDTLYPDGDADSLCAELLDAFWPGDKVPMQQPRTAESGSLWSEKDSFVITYGNTLEDGEHKPLDLLYSFLHTHLRGMVSGVHILPYFPFTSDDGFAITDYREVNSVLGSWHDIGRIAEEFTLMSDLVINHCSSQSAWFNEYLQGHEPYTGFFFEASPDDDLSQVVRPRAHPLLREVETANGTKHVWCTFSHDQVDFDFSNPRVLIEFVRILRFHLDRGVRTLRLDAIAFLWKVVGTSCIHLHETHLVVQLFRLLADYAEEPLVLITETNVPNHENLSYFGNRNEAHVVYNFSLPPLLLHGLLKGTSEHLRAWQMSQPPLQLGCTFFNFTASHDGIGMRPAEGLISDQEIDQMIDTVRTFGGLVSMRQGNDGKMHPYEVNVSLYDALKGTIDGVDDWNFERFLCCQTIAMGLEGIPAFYIHSLLATHNDHSGVDKMGYNRAINRHRWHFPDLLRALEDPESEHARVLHAMRQMIGIRTAQPAFHPNATQFTLQLGDEIFGFWRQSMDGRQSIYAIHNMTPKTLTLPALSLNLPVASSWKDLITGEQVASLEGDLELSPYQCRWISNL